MLWCLIVFFEFFAAEEFEAFKSGKKKSKKNKFKPDDAVNESNGDSIQPPPGN